jgi:N utilization substance protein B
VASRRRARDYALQALYQADLASTTAKVALDGLWAGILDGADESLGAHQPEADEVTFATTLAEGVDAKREALDARIQASSTNWRVARMSLVDRNILRLGAYELTFLNEIPVNVTINEAIELAKRFGTQDSKAFVNGILDRIARDAGRLP